MFSIDRFEGEFAVCISDDGESVKILISQLPENAKEGSIIEKIGERFKLNDTTTQSRIDKIKKLQNDLWE